MDRDLQEAKRESDLLLSEGMGAKAIVDALYRIEQLRRDGGR